MFSNVHRCSCFIVVCGETTKYHTCTSFLLGDTGCVYLEFGRKLRVDGPQTSAEYIGKVTALLHRAGKAASKKAKKKSPAKPRKTTKKKTAKSSKKRSARKARK